jgi:hypothetical protein
MQGASEPSGVLVVSVDRVVIGGLTRSSQSPLGVNKADDLQVGRESQLTVIARLIDEIGSPGRIRTSDPAVNSRLLYH